MRFFLILLALAGFIKAEERDVSFTLSAFTSSAYYKGMDTESFILPMLSARYKSLYLDGLSLGVEFYSHDAYTVYTELKVGSLGYKAKDSEYLQGMSERKQDIQTRLGFLLKNKNYQVNTYMALDFFDRHKGLESGIEYTRLLFKDDKNTLSSAVGISYLNSKKADYYFGVNKSEASLYRPAYKAGDTFLAHFGFSYIYMISEDFRVISSLNSQLFQDSVYKSPIVDKKYNVSALIGVTYVW